MASNAGQLALGALAAAVVGVAVVWLVPRPDATVVAPVAATEVEAAAVVAKAPEPVVSAEDPVAAEIAVPTVGMRVEGDGIMVVTGRAVGATDLDILLDGQPVQRIMVGGNGDYATILSLVPSAQGRILSVVANPEAEAVASIENPLIRPSLGQEPIASDEGVVVAGAVASVDEETLLEILTPEPEAEIALAEEALQEELAQAEPPEELVAEPGDTGEVDATVTENAGVEADIEIAQSLNDDPTDATKDVTAVLAGSTDVSEGQGDDVAELIDEVKTPEEDATASLAEEESLLAEPGQALASEETSIEPETQLVADADGVRVVSAGSGPQVLSNVALDSISYDPTGEVLLTGRATGNGFVQVYVDNKPVTTSRIAEGGDWRTDLPEVDTGVYTLRIDEVDAAGDVVSRIETPFKREEPEAVAAVLAEETAQEDFRVAVKTVQPGATLWAIAREQFGEGIMYVAVYEANKDQIRDPDLIYPGQVFKIPEVAE